MREGHGRVRGDVEAAARRKQQVGSGGCADAFVADDVGVDVRLDQGREPGELEHRQRAGAGRHHRSLEPGVAGGLQVATYAGKGCHATLLQPAHHCIALAVRQAPGASCLWRVVGFPLGETDPPAIEEGVDPFDPRVPLDVSAVVRATVEGREMQAGVLGHLQQKRVEDLAPGPGMQQSAVAEDAVQVEQTGVDCFGKTQHPRAHPHRRQPRQGMKPPDLRQTGEQLRGLLSLPPELESSLPQI